MKLLRRQYAGSSFFAFHVYFLEGIRYSKNRAYFNGEAAAKETMRLSGFQRKEKRRERAIRRELSAVRSRYLKRMRRRRFRRQRCAAAALFAAALVYLFCVSRVGDTLFTVQEEYSVSVVLPHPEEGKREVFHVTFRLKSGELLFFHETAEIHNTAP